MLAVWSNVYIYNISHITKFIFQLNDSRTINPLLQHFGMQHSIHTNCTRSPVYSYKQTTTVQQNLNINLMFSSWDSCIDHTTHLVLYDVWLQQHFVNVAEVPCVLLSLLVPAEVDAESEEVTTKITRMLNVTFLYADFNKKENFIVPNIILLTKAASQAVLQHEIIWVHIGEFFMI